MVYLYAIDLRIVKLAKVCKNVLLYLTEVSNLVLQLQFEFHLQKILSCKFRLTQIRLSSLFTLKLYSTSLGLQARASQPVDPRGSGQSTLRRLPLSGRHTDRNLLRLGRQRQWPGECHNINTIIIFKPFGNVSFKSQPLLSKLQTSLG